MNEIQEIEAELQLINERYLRNKEEHERRCKNSAQSKSRSENVGVHSWPLTIG